eukprot:m.1113911 g.1113911  ORF g.1113911 m.1113911 type:complete len:100 (-) comp24363_c0_seq56:1618-1917(-)
MSDLKCCCIGSGMWRRFDRRRCRSADAADTVRVVVDECLASFRRDVHRDIHNMHIDLIRQFQIQKNEMEHLLSSLSLNEDLVAEIARLREENQQLRQRF